MKKIFLFFLLLVSCCGFSQTVSQFSLLSTRLENSYLFAVGTQALQTNIDISVAKVLEELSSSDSVLTHANYVSFIAESGLYSGFGTAWHRRNALTLEGVNAMDTFEWHCDLFSTSLIQKEQLELPLFEPDLQVSFGYQNSF